MVKNESKITVKGLTAIAKGLERETFNIQVLFRTFVNGGQPRDVDYFRIREILWTSPSFERISPNKYRLAKRSKSH